jgi:hypothetical protein
MSAGAEAYQLGPISEVWTALIIILLEADQIDQ